MKKWVVLGWVLTLGAAFVGGRMSVDETHRQAQQAPRERYQALAAAHRARDAPTVRSAIAALEERGPDAAEDLVDHLIRNLGRHPAGTAWGGAEHTIARLGGDRGRYALLDRVRVGTGAERDNAISALLYTDDPVQHEALLALVDRTDPDARKRILDASFSSGRAPREAVLRGLVDDDDELASTALRALAETEGPAAAEHLAAILADGDRSSEVREVALEALVGAGPPDIEARLVDALEDPDLASSALNHLSELGTDGAGRVIADIALEHDDPELREAALSSLSWTGTVDDEKGLFMDALDDEEKAVRDAAIGGLESLGTTVAAEALLDLVREGGEDAYEAAHALDRLGGRMAAEHRELLEGAMEEPDEPVVDTGL